MVCSLLPTAPLLQPISISAATSRRIRTPECGVVLDLLVVDLLGTLSRCQSLRDLERFAIRHYCVLSEVLGLELERKPSCSSFQYTVLQMGEGALCAAIRDWTIAQIPRGAGDLDVLICGGKTLLGSIEPTAGAVRPSVPR